MYKPFFVWRKYAARGSESTSGLICRCAQRRASVPIAAGSAVIEQAARGTHLINTRKRVHDDSILPQNLHRVLVDDILPSRLLIVLWSVLHSRKARNSWRTVPCIPHLCEHTLQDPCWTRLHSWTREACLEALFLDASLVQHIHIPCHLGQVIHLLPFHIPTCQKFLDVLLQDTDDS